MYSNPTTCCATCTSPARYTWHGRQLCDLCFDEIALWGAPLPPTDAQVRDWIAGGGFGPRPGTTKEGR